MTFALTVLDVLDVLLLLQHVDTMILEVPFQLNGVENVNRLFPTTGTKDVVEYTCDTPVWISVVVPKAVKVVVPMLIAKSVKVEPAEVMLILKLVMLPALTPAAIKSDALKIY